MDDSAAKPSDQNVIVRGHDGDPLPDPKGTKMLEYESYERVIEGFKMASDACAHLAKIEGRHSAIWRTVGHVLDAARLEAAKLAALDTPLKQAETKELRGAPVPWRKARDRFLDGVRQATGGMRQLATCHRADFRWSVLAQELERREKHFRALLTEQPCAARLPGLILPAGYSGERLH